MGPAETPHVTKAVAQVHGELLGGREPGAPHPVVDLPDSYAISDQIICFARHGEVPAGCDAELGEVSYSSWVSAYNSIDYYIVGRPRLFLGGSAGVIAMRIVSALLSSALMAWAFRVAMAGSRVRWMPVALLFLASPMISCLAAMISPQGLEISAAAALWVGLLRLLDRHAGPERAATIRELRRR